MNLCQLFKLTISKPEDMPLSAGGKILLKFLLDLYLTLSCHKSTLIFIKNRYTVCYG